MKILFAGGGTGGHFYPIIAVSRAMRKIIEEERMVSVEMIFLSTDPYDARLLRQEEIQFIWIPAGKMRRYSSFLNFLDFFRTIAGVIKAIFTIFVILPDVIFAKGGYASFPALVAGKLFRIPVVIHESDAVPGRVNLWAASFARRIAVSFPESAKYFPQKKIAHTGDPIRASIIGGNPESGYETFGLEKNVPVIFVTGGSQGSQRVNDIVLDMLPELLKIAQVVHQTGEKNSDGVTKRAGIVLENNPLRARYHHYGFLSEAQLRDISQIITVALSRAGADSIFMLAAWHVPAIVIPLPESAQDHQRENAYSYARSGAALVVEENNLTPHLMLAEIERLLHDADMRKKLSDAAASFAKPDAAEKIAREIIRLGLEHL